MARAVVRAVLGALPCAACSGIEGDVDLAPAFRTQHHPGTDFTETDVAGPIVPYARTGDHHFFGLRPLFTAEERAWAEGDGRESVVSFLAPFGKYHSNPRTTQLRFVPLFWYTKERTVDGAEDTDWIVFPVFWAGRSNPPPHASGTGETPEFHLALFPLAGQLSEFLGYQRMQFLAWPILQRLFKRTYWGSEEEQAQPASPATGRAYSDEILTSIALLAGWTTGFPRGGSWHLLPLFYKSVWNYPPYRAPHYPAGADPSKPLPYYDKRSYLWPFIHHQKLNLDRGPGRESTLFAVWPFFKHEWGIDREFWTILWPFFRYNREYPLKRESGAAAAGLDWPVPEDVATADDNTHVLIDVLTQAVFRYERTADHERRRLLWLLYADYHTRPADDVSRVDSLAILQPIGFWKRRVTERFQDGGWQDDSIWLLTPFFQNHRRTYLDPAGNPDGRIDKFMRLWPLVSLEQNADGSRDMFAIPLLPLRLERFVKDFNDAWAAFFNVYRYQRLPDAMGGAERHTALFTLIKAYRDAHESSLSIPLLFTSRTVAEDGVRRFSRRALLGMFGYEGEDRSSGESSRTLRLFWLPIGLGD